MQRRKVEKYAKHKDKNSHKHPENKHKPTTSTLRDGGQFTGVKPSRNGQMEGSSLSLIAKSKAYYAVVKSGIPMVLTNGSMVEGSDMELVAILKHKQTATKWLAEYNSQAKKLKHDNTQPHDMSIVDSVSTIQPDPSTGKWETPKQHQQHLQKQMGNSSQQTNADDWATLSPMQRQRLRETKNAKQSKQHSTHQQQVASNTTLNNISARPTFHQVAPTAKQEPKCRILQTTGSEAMARWQNDLDDWNHRVERYRQALPWYVPTLSDWVAPHV